MTATISPAHNFAKSVSYRARHHKRFKAYVETSGLLCQECGGSGGEVVPMCDDGSGPFESCGWCEGTGNVTPYLRGEWLRYKRQEKKERAEQCDS